MVRPALRSHSMARKKRRLPGNNTTVHYDRRAPSRAHCPITKKKLHGVPHVRPSKLRKLTKTQRRPNRPYGGKVTHGALAKAIWEKVDEEYHQEEQEQEE